jgi:hypothetical protein
MTSTKIAVPCLLPRCPTSTVSKKKMFAAVFPSRKTLFPVFGHGAIQNQRTFLNCFILLRRLNGTLGGCSFVLDCTHGEWGYSSHLRSAPLLRLRDLTLKSVVIDLTCYRLTVSSTHLVFFFINLPCLMQIDSVKSIAWSESF